MNTLIKKVYCLFLNLLVPFKKKNVKIYCDEQLVDYILKNNKSLVRFGDGEFRIIDKKKGIHYQDYNDKLHKELSDIYFNYDKNSHYILSIPYILNQNVFEFRKNKWEIIDAHSRSRLFFLRTCRRTNIYGDAFLFSLLNESTYSKLWSQEKEVLLIHNDIKFAQIFEKKYGISVKFIGIPSKNAYNVIDDIYNKIYSLNKDKKLKILISAGPMAKPLVNRLANNGFIAYDTGHCFDGAKYM